MCKKRDDKPRIGGVIKANLRILKALFILKIKTKNMELRVGIIGLGYVGLPLAISFAKKYRVIGFDLDKNRVKYLSNSIDNNLDLQKKSYQY